MTAVLLSEEQGPYGLGDATTGACVRCGGLTVPEWVREELVVSPARRCVMCGDVVDPVILRNRGCALSLQGR